MLDDFSFSKSINYYFNDWNKIMYSFCFKRLIYVYKIYNRNKCLKETVASILCYVRSIEIDWDQQFYLKEKKNAS